MDRSEAIKILKEANVIDLASGDTKGRQAIDLAIEALGVDVVRCGECRHNHNCDIMVLIPQHDWIEMQKKLEGYVSTETMIVDGEEIEIDPVSYEIGYTHGQTAPTVSEDCISREWVLNLYKEWQPTLATNVYEFGDALKNAPSVAPTERTGEWIGLDECSVCGKQAYDFIEGCVEGVEYLPNYCPNCGAKMGGDPE